MNVQSAIDAVSDFVMLEAECNRLRALLERALPRIKALYLHTEKLSDRDLFDDIKKELKK